MTDLYARNQYFEKVPQHSQHHTQHNVSNTSTRLCVSCQDKKLQAVHNHITVQLLQGPSYHH